MKVDLGHWDCGCVGFVFGDKQFTILSCEGRAIVGTPNPEYNAFHSFATADDVAEIIKRLNSILEMGEKAKALRHALNALCETNKEE